MLRIATLHLLLVCSSGLAMHGVSLSKTASGLAPNEFLPKQPVKESSLLRRHHVKDEALKEAQEPVTNSFGIPKWLAEAALGVTMSSTASAAAPREATMPAEATKKEAQEVVPPDNVILVPVPATAKCIVILCIQYALVYAALAACRTYHEWAGTAKGKVEAGLKAAAQTQTYGPMLCVLFIACRMRVEFLSDWKDAPQMWVHSCMYAVTFSVAASTLLVLLIAMMKGRAVPLQEHLHDLERLHYFERNHIGEDDDNKVAFTTLTIMRYLVFVFMYGGLAGLIIGIRNYVPPGVTHIDQLPAPCTAVTCTMILAVVFFIAQLVIAVSRTYEEVTHTEFPAVRGVMNATSTVAEYAPMLAILFLCAQMRALQHSDQPQLWAQSYMFMATGAWCVSVLVAGMIPIIMGGQMSMNPFTRETTFVVPDPTLGYVFQTLRFISTLSFHGAAVGVAGSIFSFEAPIGATLHVSSTTQCVVFLAGQFFFVYLLMSSLHTLSEVSGGRFSVQSFRIYSAVEDARATVAFAPVLSILFVTTRMFALLISDRKSAPQVWVQDGMFICTWCLLMAVLACLFSGLVDIVPSAKDGNAAKKFLNRYITFAITVFRYTMFIGLFYGFGMVIVGLFVMTPATATGHGSSLPMVSVPAAAVRTMYAAL